MNQSRVLIVDDEISVCQSMAAALENSYEVCTALSGEEGLRLALEDAFDIMILDIMMPGMSGMDILTILKKKRPGTQIIMVTGYPSTRTAVQSIKNGAFDYIPKPFTPEELRALVKRALVHKRLSLKQSPNNRDTESAPSNYYLIPDHAWAQVLPNGAVRVGIHPVFLKTIPGVTRLEFPEINETIYQGNTCLQIYDQECRIHRMWSPVSGCLLEIHSIMKDNLQPARNDPYDRGWILILAPLNLHEELSFLALTP
ncbi:MAG TPA: response regulator [bacterium]|nr:response regulator [bacterium]